MVYCKLAGTRFQRILCHTHTHACTSTSVLNVISNNNVTHTIIAKPKFSSAYNMSYAEVKYSDETANYVS